MTTRLSPLVAALTAAALLAGCSGSERNEIAEIDNAIIGNDVDPALTSALEDQILVDPELAQQSNRLSVRPAATPPQAQYPAAGGAGAGGSDNPMGIRAAQNDSDPGSACGVPFQYGRAWADRLPAAFPPYPGGRLTDAAGADAGNCRMRVVTFKTNDAATRVLDWYHQKAVAAGFAPEHQRRGADHVLAGAQAGADGAFYLIVTPEGSGADVALIANQGR